jgi:hypothetical protein
MTSLAICVCPTVVRQKIPPAILKRSGADIMRSKQFEWFWYSI